MKSCQNSIFSPVVFLAGLLLTAGSPARGETPVPLPSNQGYIGLGIQNVTPELVREKKLPGNQGLLITIVTPQAPAAAAGLKVEDVLIELEGKDMPDDVGFGATIRRLAPGKQVGVKYVRDGRIETTTITVGEMPLALAYLRRGYERANQGELPGAIADYTEAIRLDPTNPDSYLNRGLSKTKSISQNGGRKLSRKETVAAQKR